MTKEDFKECGLKFGPATLLAKRPRSSKKPKLSFSFYNTMSDLRSVLNKFGIDSNSLADIPQFSLLPF